MSLLSVASPIAPPVSTITQLRISPILCAAPDPVVPVPVHGEGSRFSDAYIQEMRAPMQTDMNLFLEVLAGAFALAVVLLRIGLV